jgi:hypothetical protein
MGCEHPHHSESDGMAEKCAARQACPAHPLDTPALEPNPAVSRPQLFFRCIIEKDGFYVLLAKRGATVYDVTFGGSSRSRALLPV